MSKAFGEILTADIKWGKNSENIRYFFTYYNSELFLLRLNDFPDEPMLTLIKGIDILDLDDPPANWIIPW